MKCNVLFLICFAAHLYTEWSSQREVQSMRRSLGPLWCPSLTVQRFGLLFHFVHKTPPTMWQLVRKYVEHIICPPMNTCYILWIFWLFNLCTFVYIFFLYIAEVERILCYICSNRTLFCELSVKFWGNFSLCVCLHLECRFILIMP